MALAVVTLRAVIDLSPIASFLILVLFGVSIYFILGFALRIRNFSEALEVGRAIFEKRTTEVPVGF